MKRISLFLFILLMLACQKKDNYILSGKLFFNGKSVYDAEVQIFLKQEKEKETPPLKVVATDEKGVFSINLPEGKYYLIAKKKYIEQGEADMLFGEYPENPVVLKQDTVIKDWVLESKKAKKSFSKGTGITGKVEGFKNYRNTRVYIYSNTDSGLRGPDYISQAKIDEKGNFTVDLPKGEFYIVVRERKGRAFGLLKEGDLTGAYKANPVIIKDEGYINVGVVTLSLVDKKKVMEINEKGIVNNRQAELTGMVVDRDGKPVKNIYVLLYDNPEMVGRPALISTPTNSNGRFTVSVINPGKYYVGARSKIGGPAEPGELIGNYIGSPDKGVIIEKGKKVEIKIEVHEVW